MPLSDDDKAMRLTGIGSSEIGKVAGIARWGTVHDVYLEKRGLAAPRIDTLATRVGNTVEELIAQLYEEETGAKLRRSPTMRHPREFWIVATPDRQVVEGTDQKPTNRIVEIKWVGARVFHSFAGSSIAPTACYICGRSESQHWGTEPEDVPDDVRAQAEWCMEVTGTTECDVAALLAGEEFRIYRVRRNERLVRALMTAGRSFWFGHVLPGIPPPVDGSESARRMVIEICGEARQPLKEAPADAEQWVERHVEATAQIKHWEDEKATAENQLRAIIGDAEGIVGPWGKATAKLSKGHHTRTLRITPRKIA